MLYNEGMKTTNNTKALGVPSEVHAHALALSQRDGLKVYEVVAEGLRLYEAIIKPAQKDSDQ